MLIADRFFLRHYKAETVSGPVCRNGPEGASHKRILTPFPPYAPSGAWVVCRPWVPMAYAMGYFLGPHPGRVVEPTFVDTIAFQAWPITQ